MRRPRFLLVFAAIVVLCSVAVAFVAWRQRNFWLETGAHVVRERLTKEYGADFQALELRVQWFPPAVSFGRVTFHPPGDPWVLTAEDVRASFNLYAVLFGRERLGTIVLRRPSLFLRASAPGAPSAIGDAVRAPGAPAGAAAPPLRPESLLRSPLPFRGLEVQEGRIRFVDREGRRITAEGVNLRVLVSRGQAQGRVKAGRVAVELPDRRVELGEIDADLLLAEGRIAVRELSAKGGLLTGTLRGTVDLSGGLALEGNLASSLERVADLLQPALRVGGAVRFSGKVAGRWDDPSLLGTLSVREPRAGGRRWPAIAGKMSWSGRRLGFQEMRLAVGEGRLTASGELDLGKDTPAYRLLIEAEGLDPGAFAALEGPVAQVRDIRGSVSWEGEGFAAPTATGHGSARVSFGLSRWPGEQASLEAEATLGDGAIDVSAYRAAFRSLSAGGSGIWQPGAGFAGRIAGTVDDLQALFPEREGTVAGRAFFEGELSFEGAVPRFAGTARLERATIGKLVGLAAGARIEAAPDGVRLTDGTLSWAGGQGTLAGSVALPSGELNLVTVLRRLELAEAARLLRADPALVRGSLAATLAWRGTLEAPLVSGEVKGGPIGYRRLTLDAAAFSFSYADRRLEVPDLRVSRGGTSLVFRGELRDSRVIAGSFESVDFDLGDFLREEGLELAGPFRGRIQGELDDPVVTGELRAERLRLGGWDFKGGLLAVDYREGKAGLTGWILAEENRFRAVIEPAYDWRFEADLELRQFSPELVRPGIEKLPPAVGKALGRASFLASGRLHASGRLRDMASLQGDLLLDALWFHAGGKSLQNVAPVKLAWRAGELTVEDFRLAGDEYHVNVRGTGGLAKGWALEADGAVNLSVFRDYWSELQEIDGLGDVRLTLRGPWLAPSLEGTIGLGKGFVKVRSLADPLENLAGRIELAGRTLTAANLSGTIAGSAFRGRGSYSLADGLLDAEVEGRFDLALFRSRLPWARDLKGPVDVRLALRGPLTAPVFSGEADVVDAELFVRPIPTKIMHVKGRVILGLDRLEVKGLTALVGGGTLSLAGGMDWSRPPARVDFDVVGRGILLSLAGAVKAQSDMDLGLHGNFQDLKLAGEVRLLKGRYLLEFGEKLPPLSGAAGADTAAASGRPGSAGGAGLPDLARLALDLKVRAADNIWIANKIANIEAAVDLHVGGTVGAPIVRGEIQGIQGEAYYLSRLFRLESGSLRFVPPSLVPQVEVQASTTIGEIQLLFIMEGPVNKPSYHLSSVPPLSQEDLVSLLTIGQTRSSLARRGDRASALGAAVFSSGPIVNALGDQARSLGVETLQVEPVVGEASDVSARVTLGTHLSERLFLSYSRSLGATEDQQVKVEYRLLDYLSLWGQELRQGVYSLDVVFRYAFQ